MVMYLDTVLDGVVHVVITEHLDDGFASNLVARGGRTSSVSGEPECFPRWFDVNSSDHRWTLVWYEVQQVCFREVECVGFVSNIKRD